MKMIAAFDNSMCKKILLLFTFILGCFVANAQVDTIGPWRFGITGSAIFSGQYGTIAVSPYLGIGFGAFARIEPNQCTHYQLDLTYEQTGFIRNGFVQPYGNEPIFKLNYLTLRGERGKNLNDFFRLQYGLHVKYLTAFDDGKSEFVEKKELAPIDVGVNVGLFVFPSKGLSVGARYSQGFVNTFKEEKYSRTTSGLNWNLMLQLYVALF